MAEIVVTSDNFEETVTGSDKPVLIDFWASWCAPCRMLSPIIAQIAEEHPEITVGKVNTDDCPELAQRFNIEGIPTVIMFKNGEIADISVGFKPKEEIEKML